MGMLEAYRSCIQNYVNFSGRARRSEYWYFALCNAMISMILSLLFLAGAAAESRALVVIALVCGGTYAMFAIIPSFAVTIRRLHDTGHSGAHYFLILIPFIGSIILLVYMCRDSVPDNQYGPNPKAVRMPVPTPGENVPVQGFAQNNIRTSRLDSSETIPVARAGSLRAVCMTGPNPGMSASGDVVYIGRDPSRCQLVFPSGTPGVSSVHCMVYTDGQSIAVRDLHSSYGTYLSNGGKLQPDVPSFMHHGGVIFIGSKDVSVSVELVSSF